MGIKIQVINESIRRIEKRVAKIKCIIYANPLGGIIECRKKANEIIIRHKGDYPTIAKQIDQLAKEEKRLFALSKKQKDTNKLIQEQVKLESELSELNNELWLIDMKARINGRKKPTTD